MCLFISALYLFNPRQIHCSSLKTTDIMIMTPPGKDCGKEESEL
jgi:hypothetical protein